MQFSEAYITDYGHQLLGTVTAASTASGAGSTRNIVWRNAKTISTAAVYDYNESTINALTDGSSLSYSSEGNVVDVAYSDDNGEKTVFLSCTLRNTATVPAAGNPDWQKAYGFAVWAKYEDEPDTAYKIALFARCAKAHGSTPADEIDKVPLFSVEPWQAEVNFSIKLTNNINNSIALESGYYARAVALQNLLNRTVTTVSATSTSSSIDGDDQDIYGDKTFKENTKFHGNTEFSTADTTTDFKNTVNFKNNTTSYASFSPSSIAFHTNDFTLQNAVPKSNSTYNLGTDQKRWNYVYSNYVNSPNITATSISSSTVSATTFTGALSGNATSATKATNDVNGNPINSTYVKLAGDATITGTKTFSANGYPIKIKSSSYDHYVQIGPTNDTSYTYTYRFTKAEGYYVKNGLKISIYTTATVGSSSPYNLTSLVTKPSAPEMWSIGTSDAKLKDIYAVTFHGALDGAATQATYLAASGNNQVYAYRTSNTNQGIAPSNSSSTNYVNLGKSNAKFRTLYCEYVGAANSLISHEYVTCLHAWGDDVTSSGIRFCDGSYEPYSYACITGHENRPNCSLKFHHYNAANGIDYVVTSTGPNTTDNSSTPKTLITLPETDNSWSIGSSARKLKYIYSTYFYGHASSARNLSTISDGTTSTKLSANDNNVIASTHFIPSYNNTYDLGSSNYKWRKIYGAASDNIKYIRLYSTEGTSETVYTNKSGTSGTGTNFQEYCDLRMYLGSDSQINCSRYNDSGNYVDAISTMEALQNIVAWTIAGDCYSNPQYSTVGSVRMLYFITGSEWARRVGLYMAGSELYPAFLRTDGADADTYVRLDASSYPSSAMSGTWKMLHNCGKVRSGKTLFGLFVRVL